MSGRGVPKRKAKIFGASRSLETPLTRVPEDPLIPLSILSHFAPLLKKAALPTIRFHDLRHTCATLLLGRNVNPKVVSEMLGHATIAITLDTYSHVLPDMQDHAARALEDALS